MVKKGGFIAIAVFIVVFSSINLFLYFNEDGTSYSSVSGRAITDWGGLPLELNFSTIAFIAQWIILLVIVLFAYAKFIKHKQEEDINIDYSQLRPKKTRAETDLDTFYDLLKERKSLSTGAIAKIFKITKEKALEWGKILEDHELAVLDYPAFNDPEVRINEKEGEKTDQTKKETSKEEKGKEKFGEKEKGRNDKPESIKPKPGEAVKAKTIESKAIKKVTKK